MLPERDWLLARLAAAPDLTIRALRAELETERGLRVNCGAVWRWLAREDFTFQKACTPPSSINPTSHAAAHAGGGTSNASTRPGSYLSLKPGPRPM